ncbi:MAG: VanW family protein [Clostridia bacterium]|nr:VanW family protein [Clostridia bacterium]
MPQQNQNRERETDRFPFWTVIVLLCCLIAWLIAAKAVLQLRDDYAQYREKALQLQAADGVFCSGVTLDGIDLGGMTRVEAEALFGGREQQQSGDFTLNVTAQGKQWRIDSEVVPLVFDYRQQLERAYLIGHSGTMERRLAEMDAAGNAGAAFTSSYVYDRGAIDNLVAIIASNVDRPARDATLDAFDPITKTFSFKKEEAGWLLDQQTLAQQILSALDSRDYGKAVQATGDSVEPAVKARDLEGHFGLVSAFTTQTTADRDRNTNISISAAALNGKVVAPGEQLSFNNSTGKRTGEKGYREAGAIAGGVLVDDTGGGVCQTSSTLFNAVVRADLEIVKRYAHSWPSSYVPKGEDATVNWPSRDFIFRNSSEYPVFLLSWYKDRMVTVEVYGKLPETWSSIDLESKTVKTIKPSNDTLYTLDESLPVGTRQAGHSKHTGYIVDTYKIYKDAEGNETGRVKLWTTEYPATQNEILYH